MTHGTQSLRRLSSTSTRTRSAIDGIAWVGIFDKTGRPGLFVPEVRPGAQVFFGTQSATEPIEVRFEGLSPFVDERTQFTVLPGPAVPFQVRADAEGEFRFVFRPPAGGPSSDPLLLDVLNEGPSARLQFLATATGSVSQSFVRSETRRVDLVIENGLDHGAVVGIDGPGRQPQLEEIDSGKSYEEPVQAPAFGKILEVRLVHSDSGQVQSGGTEQIEIILEPD